MITRSPTQLLEQINAKAFLPLSKTRVTRNDVKFEGATLVPSTTTCAGRTSLGMPGLALMGVAEESELDEIELWPEPEEREGVEEEEGGPGLP